MGVVGLGLIGGSMALDLRRQGLVVHGLVHRADTAERARQRGLVDRVSCDPAVLADCGLVVLALPLDQLLNPDPALVKSIPPDAVLTDVGSVKGPVLACWESLHRHFVPSHPMAGTALSGVEAGVEGLFEGRPWVATPSDSTEAPALECVREFAACLGARWILCPAAAHDQAVALISHLPVLVSAALLQAADAAACTMDGDGAGAFSALVRDLASSGFADTSRVGGGNPQLGTLMARCNREAVQMALRCYQDCLAAMVDQIDQAHWHGLHSALAKAQQLRPGFVDWEHGGEPGSP